VELYNPFKIRYLTGFWLKISSSRYQNENKNENSYQLYLKQAFLSIKRAVLVSDLGLGWVPQLNTGG
jgi:hypothetical protein